MFQTECAFRREDGVIRFIRESRMDEARDDLCILKAVFRVDEIYPPEEDTGAELDWNGPGIAEIHMRRCAGWTRWRVLNGDEFEAAKTFLQEEYAEELQTAEFDYAEAVYFGEVA